MASASPGSVRTPVTPSRTRLVAPVESTAGRAALRTLEVWRNFLVIPLLIFPLLGMMCAGQRACYRNCGHRSCGIHRPRRQSLNTLSRCLLRIASRAR